MFWLQNYTFYMKEKNNHAKSLADKRKSSTFAADFDLKEVIGAGTGADSYYYKPFKIWPDARLFRSRPSRDWATHY